MPTSVNDEVTVGHDRPHGLVSLLQAAADDQANLLMF